MAILSPTNGLSQGEHEIIRNFARESKKLKLAQLDEDGIREDFYGLHSDIVHELKTKDSGMIAEFYELSEVLNDISMLCTPETAYMYGCRSRKAGIDANQGFMDFTYYLSNAIDASGLSKKRDTLFYKICDALGDARGLLSEFIDLHNKVNVEQFYVHCFFDLGFSDNKLLA